MLGLNLSERQNKHSDHLRSVFMKKIHLASLFWQVYTFCLDSRYNFFFYYTVFSFLITEVYRYLFPNPRQEMVDLVLILPKVFFLVLLLCRLNLRTCFISYVSKISCFVHLKITISLLQKEMAALQLCIWQADVKSWHVSLVALHNVFYQLMFSVRKWSQSIWQNI